MPIIGATPYPDLNLDALKLPRQIEEYNHTYKLSKRNPPNIIPDAPAYSHVSAFFDGVIETLQIMQGRLKLEFVFGELISELSKWRLAGDTGRPSHFPTTFNRAWLSNVP